jgi:SAM-dependent methyltransferase
MRKDPNTSGRDHYSTHYQDELSQQARWLAAGASEKANSIEFLLALAGTPIHSIIELGCGTGEVLRECQRRGLADRFVGVDYSRKAIEYLRETSSGIDCVCADIANDHALDGSSFDVVILSHVLEHLEAPRNLLSALPNRIRFKFLVAEVPLEDLAAARLKNLFRDRYRNTAGHVQFYNERTFRDLLGQSGYWVSHARRYAPVVDPNMIQSRCRYDGLSKPAAYARTLTQSYLPRTFARFWSHFYHAHFAALCFRDQQ